MNGGPNETHQHRMPSESSFFGRVLSRIASDSRQHHVKQKQQGDSCTLDDSDCLSPLN